MEEYVLTGEYICKNMGSFLFCFGLIMLGGGNALCQRKLKITFSPNRNLGLGDARLIWDGPVSSTVLGRAPVSIFHKKHHYTFTQLWLQLFMILFEKSWG